MKLSLVITGNGERYEYNSATDSMKGNGEHVDLMNNIIEIADYGDNPFLQIVEIMEGLEYKVVYKPDVDTSIIDGIS